MKTLAIVATAVIIVFGSIMPACAEAPAPKAASSFENASLNLTAEQSEKIQALRENRWKELKPLRNKLFAMFEDLKSMMTRNGRDESKIKMLQSEILAMQSRIHDRLTAYRMELKKILTPEQQSKLTAFGLERGYFRGAFKPAAHNGNSTGDARRQ